LAVLAITGGLVSQIGKLRVEIDPARFLPQSHPYVVTSNRVEELFGSKYVLLVGITPQEGDAFTPSVLAKAERITKRLREDPGVLKSTILSVAAKKAKSITGTADGMEIKQLMEHAPNSAPEIAALRSRLQNNPAYLNAIVSKDERSIAVIAEFRDDPKGFRAIMERVNPILDAERDASVRIATGGLPVMLSQLEIFSERIGMFMPIAMLLVGLVLWLSFRSVQGMFLPMLTGILAVLWSLGMMSRFGVPLDVFNATTPILILAVAAGHAVQMLKRYQEEYARLQGEGLDAKTANRQAVIESVTRVGPVMMIAAGVAALSFLSLTVFEISSIRTFGIFSACGISGALVLELTLIPALRSWMRPPRKAVALQDKGRVPLLMQRVGEFVLNRPWTVGVTAGLVAVVALIGANRVRFDDGFKNQFSSSIPAMQDDAYLNSRFGGTNALYVLIEGDAAGRMQDPAVQRAMDGMQRLMESDRMVGKTLSIVDFVKRMNRAMHSDDPKFDTVPENRDLIAQYLFLYSNGGDPSDFDTYVDNDYKYANIWGFLREHDTQKLDVLVTKLKAYAAERMPPGIRVSFGGSVAQGAAIHEIIVRTKALNMLQLAGVVFALTALAFRSIQAGVLVLVPLVATVLFNLGLMGWTDIPMDITNSITSAMAVGIGADYVIYFLFRLREERQRTASFDEALQRTMKTAGTAIFFVAAAIAAGYSVLLFSFGFWTHIWMAILISSAMIVSATAALTIVPLIIGRLRPKFVGSSMIPSLPQSASAVILLGALAFGVAPDSRAQTPSADDVMTKNYMVDKVIGSQSRVTMTLRNSQGQERIRESDNLTRLQPGSADSQRVVRFSSPADVKGTAILLVEHSKADDDMWIYLPALKKVRRLVASNKKDSFAGSDFSYGDVIGHQPADWKHQLVGSEDVGGEPCFVIESVPGSNAVRESSGYSKRKSWISKARFVLVKLQAWDTEGQLLKEASYSDFKVGDKPDRWVPMRIQAKNVQTGHQTDLVFRGYRIEPAIAADVFSANSLDTGH
jgi:hydrophobe/amphiphile efflux-3 (HAE3) family protein